MTRAETDPMPRLLLALSLYAIAAVAFATPPPATEEANGKPVKPSAPAAAATDSDAAPAATPAPAPSRAGSSARPSAKRWHSMLPGMIR